MPKSTAYSDLIAHLADYCLDSKTEPASLPLRDDQLSIIMAGKRDFVLDVFADQVGFLYGYAEGNLKRVSSSRHESLGHFIADTLRDICSRAIKDDLEAAIANLNALSSRFDDAYAADLAEAL
jgi:hypothetical protein